MRTPGYELWPSQPLGKSTPNYKGNAGDFVLARRSILDRFALPWLLALHDLDPDLYATMAFESCLQVVDNKDSVSLDAVDQVQALLLYSVTPLTLKDRWRNVPTPYCVASSSSIHIPCFLHHSTV